MSYLGLMKNETFQDFLDQVRERAKEQETIMKSETDTARIFRAQGAVTVLEALLEYPEQQAVIEDQDAKEAADASRGEAEE